MGNKIGYKITRITITLTLFLVMASAITPSIFAVEWTADIRLTLDDSLDSAPSIAQAANGDIWVVWDSDRTGNHEIFYKVHNGVSWSNEIQLTNDSNYDSYPSITRVSNGDMWVVWDSNRMGNHDIFYTVYNGSSWSDAYPLTSDLRYDSHPAIVEASDGNIWVVWESDRNLHDLDLYYKVFDGSSWSSDLQLTTDQNTDDEYPSVMQATDGMVWVVFTKIVDETNEELYYKVFNGSSWSIDVRLTWNVDSDSHPSITQASDGAIWVVWDSDRNGHDDNIYYKVFDEFWGLDTKLTTDLSDDFMPSVTPTTDGAIWVVWASTRLANFDIYCKTTIVSQYHDIAIVRVTTDLVLAIRGETVSIEVTAQNEGTYGESFEVQCHANSTMVSSTTIFLSPGQANTIYPSFNWNTTGVPPGKYIISATAVAVQGETDLADNSKNADESVEVRILGDICGMYARGLAPIPDRVVNLDDIIAVAMPGHIFSQAPTWDPVWGPVCDLNKDGKVGVADLIIVSLHFGER